MILLKTSRTRKLLKAIGLPASLSIVATVTLAGYLVLMHRRPLILPAPTGSYKVGRTEYDLVDDQRFDPFFDQVNEQRELLVWVWYPATKAVQGPTAPLLPSGWVKLHDQDQGIGKLIESDLSAIQPHSFEGDPLAESPLHFPVIIMQPGMGPVPTDYTVMAENLASQGYVVLGINQTYSSNVVVFPGGRVALRTDKGTISEDAGAAEVDRAASRIGKV